MNNKNLINPKHATRLRSFPRGAFVVTVILSMLGGAMIALLASFLITNSTFGINFSLSPPTTPTPSPTQEYVSPETWTSEEGIMTELTAPGTTLEMGQEAMIELETGIGKNSLVQVTLISLEPASPSQQFTLRKSLPQLEGMDVYFSTFSLTKVDGVSLAGYDVVDMFSTISKPGVEIPRLKIADWKDCGSSILPPQIDEVGAPITVCLASATPKNGLTPEGADFSQAGGVYDRNNSANIIWLTQKPES